MENDLVRAARAELARRELARREFKHFARWYYPGWPPDAAHLTLLAEKLQQVERYVATGGREGIGRLMIFMPPRHWKSTTASTIFPVWLLGRNPEARVIITSYNASLAVGFSRRARNLVHDTGFRAVFGDLAGTAAPLALADDSQSAEEWNLAGHIGGVVAAGVGGGITGKGAHLLIIDDPHRDRAEAESATKRDAVWAWYTSTAYTRLEPGGAVVVILTRWHSDDLAGRLLKLMATDPEADRWETLVLPARAEDWAAGVADEESLAALRDGWVKAPDALGRQPGAALWDRYDGLALDKIRSNIGAYDWEALYQQRPQRLEGAMIKAYDIPQVAAAPEGIARQVRYWDLAVSGNATADAIAGARVGRGTDGKLYILDIVHLPGPWSTARARMLAVMLADPAGVVQGIEVSGQQGGYYQEFKRDPQLAQRTIVPVNPARIGSKEVRAQVWASRIQDGLIALVRGPWDVSGFLSECVAFPKGAHDDRVDAVSGAVLMLGQGAGVRPAASYQG